MNAQENMLGWLRATLKPEFDAVAEKIDVQADITGQLGASFHALAARVAALEANTFASKLVTAQGMPFEADTMSHEDPKLSPEQPSPRDPTFVERVRYAINTTSQENVSDTPDFILADFVTEMLDALNSAVNRRKQWWGAHEDRQRGERQEQGTRVGGTVPESSAVTSASPAPPAPLVESQIESIATEITEAAYRLSHRGDDYKWPGCIAMREAIEPILRSRLARAKEAAR